MLFSFIFFTSSLEDGLGDKLLLCTSPAWCSMLHCSLIDLTLANSLSVIYDQTAPESGIYYPLLLSVRQHYITLHCLSQFAKAPPKGDLLVNLV